MVVPWGTGERQKGVTDDRLVVPEGLVIDEVARERLTRQMRRAPADVAGVAAEVGELPSGASYRVHAEWRSLEPIGALVASSGAPVRGAALLRPGVGFEVDDGAVHVRRPLLVDAGAHVHDPRLAVGPLFPAVEEGRPPFPRRPVVVFVASEPDTSLADWARRMVNRLVRRDIEGRLALPVAPDGLHLTRPCLPGADSLRALAPDAIVTLDAGAGEQVDAWWGSDRSTVVIELLDDLTITSRLVSWQIGRARGRVRAQISRRVGAPSLATLVRRLCAGPHPLPPTDQAADEAASARRVREVWGSSSTTRTRLTCAVVTGRLGPNQSARVEGLLDHLDAAGVRVAHTPFGRAVTHEARSASVVVLVGVDHRPAVVEFLAARRSDRLATVVDVGPFDLSAGKTTSSRTAATTRQVARLARECGFATASSASALTALRDLGVKSLLLPTMLTRARASALRKSSAAPESVGGAVLGWHVGWRDDPVPSYFDAVAGGLAKVLADREDVRVEVVGDAERVPSILRSNRRVSVITTLPEPRMLAAWWLHLWTPRLAGGEVADDLGSLIDVSFAGVPSALPLPARGATDGCAPNELVVSRFKERDAWAGAVCTLIDDDAVRRRSAAAVRRWSRSVHSPSASRAAANRLIGWARYEGEW